MKVLNLFSSPQLPRTLSPLETYGFGLTGWPGWIGVFAAMNYALGASAIWVWIPATLVGILITYSGGDKRPQTIAGRMFSGLNLLKKVGAY